MNHERIREVGVFLAGAVTGAAVLYLADVDRDGHRLRMAAQRVAGPGRDLAEGVRARGRDVRNRARGLVARTSRRFAEEEVSDEQLTERVRSELGHHSERARELEVRAEHGVVHLSGDLDGEEVERLGDAARHVRGVRDVAFEVRPDAREDVR